jgi:hypothetical protein
MMGHLELHEGEKTYHPPVVKSRNIWDQYFFDFPDAKGKEDAICTLSERTAGGSCQCKPVCARCGIGPHMGIHLQEFPIHMAFDHLFVAPDPGIIVATVPVLTVLEPAQAALGAPSFTLHVRGTGFQPTDLIIWNGSPEPTTYVSATELTTGVNMATAVVAIPIPIQVRTADGRVSNTLTFTLTAARSGR